MRTTQFGRILTSSYHQIDKFQALWTNLGLHLDALAKNISLGTKMNSVGRVEFMALR